MRIERLLRSKFHRSAVVTSAFKTLEITQPAGELEESPGIQITINSYPRGSERNPHVTIILPREDAFELARDIIRIHRGPSSGRADHVGFHAMSESEALMIEAVMLWEDPELRLALWNAVGNPEKAQILLEHFARSPQSFAKLAAEELGVEET